MLSDLIKNALTIPAIIVALVVAYLVYARTKRVRAARRAAEQERARRQEAQQFIDQMNREHEERMKEAEVSFNKRVAETEAAVIANPGSEKYRLEEMQTEVNAKTLNITEFTPVSKSRYIAFDLETTGLSHSSDAIVEIGAVLVENGEITREFHQMIDPERPMPAEASAVNHITDDMLAGKPKIYQVLPAFLAFVGDDILAAHNAKFDLRFICQACMRNRFRIPVGFFDTMNLARYWPEAEDKKLTSLAAAADIRTDGAHRALSDARMVAQLIAATNIRRAESRKKKKE